MKRRRSLFRAVACLVTCVVVGACEPIADGLDYDRKAVPIFRRSAIVPPADPAPRTLKVMAWNIKFGAARIDFWFDLWGDRVQMTRSEVVTNVAALCRLIREVDPDVLKRELPFAFRWKLKLLRKATKLGLLGATRVPG
jgi:hypothetical protein